VKFKARYDEQRNITTATGKKKRGNERNEREQ
jgi:hypothetical protein